MSLQPKDPREVLNWAGAILACAVMGLFGYVIYVLATNEIPKSNENLFYAIVTGLIGLVTMVFGYFFGSSHQNKKQTEIIDTMTKAAAPSAPQVVTHPGDVITSKSETKIESGGSE